MDEQHNLLAARDEGEARGLTKGRAEGRAEGREESAGTIARNLFALGLPIEKIAEATGLTRDALKKLL